MRAIALMCLAFNYYFTEAKAGGKHFLVELKDNAETDNKTNDYGK